MAGNQKTLDLKIYATRRIMRIYPPYFAAVCISLLAVHYFEWTSPSNEPWVMNLLLVQNYLPKINSQISSNCSLWSIATEVEFYIAYPLLLIFWRKYGPSQSIALFGTISIIATWLYFLGVKGMVFCAFTFYILWWAGALLVELYATKQLPKPSKIIVIMGIFTRKTGTIAQLQGTHLVMVKRFLFGGFYVLLVWWLLTHKIFKPSECSLI